MHFLRSMIIPALAVLLCCTRSQAQDYREVLSMNEKEFRQWLEDVKENETSPALTNPFQRVPTDKYLVELAIIKRAMEEASAPMYRYATKKEMRASFAEAFEALRDSASYMDFLREVNTLIGKLRCIHSRWGHSPAFLEYRNANMKIFPADVRIIDSNLYIHRNLSSDHSLKPGTEITAINGQTIPELMDRLLPLIFSDGHIMTTRVRALEENFAMAYSNFLGNPPTFNLQVKEGADGGTSILKVAAMPFREVDSLREALYPQEKEAFWKYSFDEEHVTGILDINSFRNIGQENDTRLFRRFIDSVFHDLRKQNAQALIIDFRGNGGGWTDNGRYLVSHLVDAPCRYIDKVYIKKNKTFSIRPVMKDPKVYDDTFVFRRMGLTPYYRWKNYHIRIIDSLPENRFKGKTIVLTDGSSASCTGIVCAQLQDKTDAIFIGEETGGPTNGTNGLTYSFTLPFSGVRIRLSSGVYENQVKQRSARGVLPDYPMERSIVELLNGKDPLMGKALELTAQ